MLFFVQRWYAETRMRKIVQYLDSLFVASAFKAYVCIKNEAHGFTEIHF